MVGKNEVIVQDTKDREIGTSVEINIEPENIQIMKKEYTTNIYTDAWIDKQNNVMISEDPFECDITQLLKGSHVDEDGYLVGPDGKVYDLTDADVIAEADVSAIEIVDGFDNGQTNGVIVEMVYVGDHYRILIRTEEEEDFICVSEYSWNEGDQVSVSIKKENIKLILKGDIKQYAKDN